MSAPDPDAVTVADGTVRRTPQVGRLQAELEGMRESKTEWREVVAALPHIVWITRPDGYHVYFNQQWMDFTGLSLEESLGDGWNPPFHPAERPLARRLWNEATRTGEPYEIEYRLRRHDGVYVWMLGRALPLRNTTGEIVKWFGTCTDISEMKTALTDAAELRTKLELRAAELEFANTELARANAQVSDLVSMASHDVRQPLVAIKGFSEVVLDVWSELTEEQRLDFVSRIARAAETAERMLDDTLNTTALQGGGVIPQPASVSVVDAVRSAASQVVTDPRHLTVSGPENLAAHVDPGHFVQVLTNLLTNAVKYGAPPITVSCAQVGEDHVTVRVTDQGEGVPADFVPQLFDRFTRADSARSGAQKGTGLGLFIVRRLLEANGGTIDYQPPTPGAGGFVVTLPAVRAF